MNEIHQEFKVNDCGLHISLDNPFTGAPPDGLVSCSCCGDGCLEIKCPYCHKEDIIFEAVAADNKFCLENVNGGHYRLKREHLYYYQVQAQLHICKKQYCDFFVWTEKDFHIERILPDVDVWTKCLDKCNSFFRLCLLPELVGKFHSRDTADLNAREQAEKTSQREEQSVQLTFCYCAGPDAGHMIACDNKDCLIEWFYMDCLKINKEPKGKWYSPDCRKLDKFRRTKKKQ